jgi:hypothetical protein
MLDRVEMVAVLFEVSSYLRRPDAELGFSTKYETNQDLLEEVERQIARLGRSTDLTEDEVFSIRLLFVLTGALQDASIASGWATSSLS